MIETLAPALRQTIAGRTAGLCARSTRTGLGRNLPLYARCPRLRPGQQDT